MAPPHHRARRREEGLGAALFAVHPIQIHAVAYLSGRTTLLATLFFLLAVLAGLPSRAPEARPRLGLGELTCAGLFLLALLAKETAVTLPVLALLLWWRMDGGRVAAAIRRRLLAHLPLGGTLVGYLVIRGFVLGGVVGERMLLHDDLGPLRGTLSVAKIYGYYLETLVWPEGVWVAWIRVSLLPVSGIVATDYFEKEHYAYLASVAFCGLLACLLGRSTRLLERAGHGVGASAVWVGSLGLVLAWGFMTSVQGEVWSSHEALAANILRYEERIPEAAFAHPAMRRSTDRWALSHHMLGTELAVRGGCEAAVPHLRRAAGLAVRPDVVADAQFNLARCLFELARFGEAEVAYREVLVLYPDDPEPALRLAWLAGRRGDQSAEAYLAEACRRGSVGACVTGAPDGR